jgi:hypothetical protein
VIEKLLQSFVGEVDAKLLETIELFLNKSIKNDFFFIKVVRNFSFLFKLI